MAARAPTELTYQEYVAIEQRTGVRHELRGGLAYAMAGGTLLHAGLMAEVTRLIANALVGRPCRAFSSELKIRIPATGEATYPDLSVICGAAITDEQDKNAATNPALLLEVLSPSTEADDRGEKFALYKQLPSLREYVLVAQDERRVEVFRRNETGGWDQTIARASDSFRLEVAEATIAVNDVYRDPLA